MKKGNVDNLNVTSIAVLKAKKRKMALKRRIIKGTLIFVTAGILGVAAHAVGSMIADNVKDGGSGTSGSSVSSDNDFYSVDISADEILGVTLVNDGYDEAKFDDAVKNLQDTGLHCNGVDIDSIDVDNTNSQFLVAITPYNGDDTTVVANYNENSASDQLAVAMAVANGDDASDIQRGVKNLDQADGTFRPSKLEEIVGTKLISNVTLDCPYDEAIDTDKILEASARLTDYYKRGGSVYDKVLYRVQPGDSPFSLRDVDGKNLCDINGIDSNSVLDSNRLLLLKPLSGSLSPDASISIEKYNEINFKL